MAKQDKPLRTSKRSKKGASKKSGLTLNTISLLSFILFSGTFIVMLYVMRWSTLNIIDNQSEAIERSTADQFSSRLNLSIATYTKGIAIIAQDPLTRKTILANDAQQITERQQQLLKLFPKSLNLRLVKAGNLRTTKLTKPHVGFACVDMLNQSRRIKAPVGVEAHVFGTAQQHIDFVHPVLDAAGVKVVGYVQLSVNVNVLSSWLKKSNRIDYIELYQQAGKGHKSLLIGKSGDSSLRTSEKPIQYQVDGTQWEVRVWPSSSIDTQYDQLLTYVLLFVGVGLFAGIIFLFWRSLSRALTTDIDNLVGLVVSTVKGKTNYQYKMEMKEFTNAAKHLNDFLSNQSNDRERDSESDSIDVSSMEIDIDSASMFTASESMHVEELDEQSMASMQSQNSSKVSSQNTSQNSSQATRQNTSQSIKQTAEASMNKVMSATPPAEIFKAYDIRGIVGVSLSAEYAELIGKALGSEAAARGASNIAFARDGRLSGPELGQALVKGILSTGIDVVDVGMVPTPLLYFAAHELTKGSGVMLTGSHNPPDYNGFKMVLLGDTLAEESIQKLRQRIEKNDFVNGTGNYSTVPMLEKYLSRVSSDVKMKRPLKIVVDCGNGVAGGVAPRLYKAMGCEVIELYCDIDGKFPNHHPDPSQPKNLVDLIEAVKVHKADLGMAFDGDGDRLGVISSDGNIIWPDRLLMLFAGDVLSRNQGAQIIFDIKCTSNLTKEIWEKGGEPLMWKTGHSLIKSKMKQSGALLAGEMSGHIFFKERWYGFDDGIYSGARLLEILSNDVKQPRVIFAGLPDSVNTPELQIQMEEGAHHAFIEKLLDNADFGSANVTMIDGIRADYADGWGLVRASNTTPCLVLRFEGQTKEAMMKVQAKFKEVLHNVDPTLELPF